MDILILYKSYRVRERRTVKDHLYSFARYGENCRFVYLDVSELGKIPRCIARYPFDAVIFHYLFLAYRLDEPGYRRLYAKISDTLKCLHGVKVLIPHDEYLCTEALWELSRACGVQRIYASCYPNDYAAIFPPEKVGGAGLCRTVLTGYVDEGLQKKVERMEKKRPVRAIDVGYRALRSNYIFGRHGHVKTQVAEAFLAALPRHPRLTADIRLTSDGYRNTITGNRWLAYLLNCRATIGCLGGSSLLDPDGTLRARTRAYVAAHPSADYDAVAAHCYPGQDGRIAAYLLGPRHLECAMTRTCQLLVEGDYHGVLEPGRDYIPVKADFSDVDAALDAAGDDALCRRIAAQCYDDVVRSGKYTYRAFANGILDELRSLAAANGASSAGQSFARLMALRGVAAAVHGLNQAVNVLQNAGKALVTALTHGNPALYEAIKRRYKRG